MKISIDKIGYATLSCCKKKSIDRACYGLPNHLDMSKIFYLQEFKINKKYRLKGYSSLLLDKIKKYCDENNLVICLDAIPLDSSISTDVLHKMYIKNGFNYISGTAFNYGHK
jgi:GNAT superfamily N-acetyltransferase